MDYVFCSECEDIFTSIESPFIENILPKLRDTDLTDIANIEIAESKEIKLFFYLQVWRTHICEQIFNLPEHIAENLRQIILNYSTVENVELNKFPLSITYLQTLGGVAEYTANLVVVTNDKNPYLIFMNDFVIQFFESNEESRFLDFYGLNTEPEFEDFLNQNEEVFNVNIFQNDRRKQFINDFIKKKVKQTVQYYANIFNVTWEKFFGIVPQRHLTQEYLGLVTGGDDDITTKYSKDRIIKLTREFRMSKLK